MHSMISWKCAGRGSFSVAVLLLTSGLAHAFAVVNVPAQQPTIQAGLNAAGNNGEVILAPGIYTGAGNTNITLTTTHVLVRSSTGNPADVIIDCEAVAGRRAFVIPGKRLMLRGLTIRNGRMHGAAPDNNGGAIAVEGATARLDARECVFHGNTAIDSGGAIYANNAEVWLAKCEFFSNSAAISGAVELRGTTSARISSSRFRQNAASADGGVSNLLAGANAQWDNCLFHNNSAHFGGALHFNSNGPGTYILTSTFSANSAPFGAAIARRENSDEMYAINCIFWGNTGANGEAYQQNVASGPLFFFRSDIQGGVPAHAADVGGNLNANPMFVDPDGADNVAGTADDDFRLSGTGTSPGSPCIDAGSSEWVPSDWFDLDGDGDGLEPTPHDLNGAPRFTDDRATPNTGETCCGIQHIVDMGAYEWQTPPPPCNAPDVNCDGAVNIDDLVQVITSWGPCPPPCPADTNGSGVVDIDDLVQVITNWG